MRGKNVIGGDLTEIRRRITMRPEVIPGVPVVVRRIYIDQGNTLDTGEKGIKYEGSEITEVPTAYDPDSDTSFIDGIGRGQLEINGVLQSGYVLVVNDIRSGYGNAFLGDNGYEDGPDKPWAFYAVSIPVDGGGSVSAWVCG